MMNELKTENAAALESLRKELKGMGTVAPAAPEVQTATSESKSESESEVFAHRCDAVVMNWCVCRVVRRWLRRKRVVSTSTLFQTQS